VTKKILDASPVGQRGIFSGWTWMPTCFCHCSLDRTAFLSDPRRSGLQPRAAKDGDLSLASGVDNLLHISN